VLQPLLVELAEFVLLFWLFGKRYGLDRPLLLSHRGLFYSLC
jgi:hypothetical protein